MKKILLMVPFLLVVAVGCIAKSTNIQNIPFFTFQEDYKANIASVRKIGDKIIAQKGIWRFEDVEKFILDLSTDVREKADYAEPKPEFHFLYKGSDPESKSEAFTWKFAIIDEKIVTFLLKSRRDAVKNGYTLQVDFVGNKVSQVGGGVISLTDKESEISSRHLISAGVAAAGTLLLISGP